MKSIFLVDLPATDTQEQLESLQGKYPQYSREYLACASIKDRREWIEKMWALCHKDVEHNFPTELATPGRFMQKAWELVIGTFLKKSGFELLRKTGEGPDFSVMHKGKKIWIEATAPGVGDVDPAPERPDIKLGEMYVGGGDIEEGYRTLVLRLLSAIRNKSDKLVTSQYYKGIRNGLIHPDDPYVVAINGYEFSGVVSDPFFLLRRSVFAAGCLTYKQLEDGSLGKPQYRHEPFVIKNKPDGEKEEIPSDVFRNDSYPEISAIIYSAEHIINTQDDLNKLGKKIFMVKNPFAKNPVSDDFLQCGYELVFNDLSISEINNNR